jgi:hypothetical protein
VTVQADIPPNLRSQIAAGDVPIIVHNETNVRLQLVVGFNGDSREIHLSILSAAPQPPESGETPP